MSKGQVRKNIFCVNHSCGSVPLLSALGCKAKSFTHQPGADFFVLTARGARDLTSSEYAANLLIMDTGKLNGNIPPVGVCVVTPSVEGVLPTVGSDLEALPGVHGSEPIFYDAVLREYISKRFWSKVNKNTATGCWLWTGCCANGYGNLHGFRHQGRTYTYRAHRLSYMLHFGPIPTGLFICHHCDTPSCVRPDHLFIGSAADNKEDSVSKGRHQHGETHHFARLTRKDVEQIRSLYMIGGITQHELACKFGVSYQAINGILRGRRWGYSPLSAPERYLRGESCSFSKLTKDDVERIRELYARGGVSQRDLSFMFGVVTSTIHDIVNGFTWGYSPVKPLNPNRARGAKNKASKLNISSVLEIRQRYEQGESVRLLSSLFGVSASTIGRVVHRKVWGYVE
jgi:transposase